MSCVDHVEVMILTFVQRLDTENSNLWEQYFQFKREDKHSTSIQSICSNV